MKLLLTLLITFVNLACNDRLYTLNTCDLNVETIEKKYITVKIIAIDSNLNEKASKKNECYFCTAIDIHQKDTFNIIDVKPDIRADRITSYYHNNYLFAFTLQTEDSCVKCSYKQAVFYKKNNEFRLLLGKLKVMVQ